MNDDDPKWLPTRHGEATGHANERTMAARIERNGLSTVIRDNGDGSSTMLRTRAGMNEYTTTRETAKQVEVDKEIWSYDFMPVNSALAADTATVGSGVYPTMSGTGQLGEKVRRKGITGVAGGISIIPAMESKFQLNNLSDPMSTHIRGPGYWYSGTHKVTWTTSVRDTFAGGVFKWAAGRIKPDDGENEIEIHGLINMPSNNTEVILAACRVYLVDTPYIRVLVGNYSGVIATNLRARDYDLSGTLVTESGPLQTGTGVITVSGKTFSAFRIGSCSWSPDGSKVIMLVADANGAYGLIMAFPAPGNALTPTYSLYTPPVWETTAPAPETTDTGVVVTQNSTSSSGTHPNTNSPFKSIDNTTGIQTDYHERETGYSYNYAFSSNRTNTSTVHAVASGLSFVGFNAANVPCATVVIKRSVTFNQWYEQTVSTTSTTFSAYTDYAVNITGGGVDRTDYYSVPTASTLDQVEDNTVPAGSTVETVTHTIESHYCENSTVIATRTNTVSYTTFELTAGTDSYHRYNSAVLAANLSHVVLSYTVPDTVDYTYDVESVSYGTHEWGLDAVLTDFKDGAVALLKWGPVYYGAQRNVDVAAYNGAYSGFGGGPTPTHSVTPLGDAALPTTINATIEILNKGAIRSSRSFSWPRTSSNGFGEMVYGWHPTHKSFLAVARVPTPAFSGLHYSKGQWNTVRVSSSEPSQPSNLNYDASGFKFSNLCPFV